MRKYLILLILLVTGFSGYSQTIGGGFKIGANYTGILGEEVSAEDIYDRKLGLHGGLVLDFGVSQIVSIKPELLYSSKGFEYDNIERELPAYKYSVEGKETFHCIDVPVLVNVKVGKLFFEAGPLFSLLVARDREVTEKRTYALGTIQYIESNSIQTEAFNFFEYGFAAGLGYQFQSRFNFGLRYNASIRHIQEDEQSSYPFPKDARNSVFQLSIGYMFYEN